MAPIKVLVEEAGGAFLTRGGVPLVPAFDDAVLSANRPLAEKLARFLGF